MRFESQGRISWYRCPIDRELLHELMKRSDLRGWIQTVSHLGLFLLTGLTSYLLFSGMSESNWTWMLPLLLCALFVHGTVGSFMGFVPVHELQHRTVFKTQALNKFFEKLYAFVSWSDYIWYQQSHPIHHLTTCHAKYDGEVLLPIRVDTGKFGFWLALFAWHPLLTLAKLRMVLMHARGIIHGSWYRHVLPEDQSRLRRRHRDWARTLLLGHGLLACLFVVTGHWFLIFIFNFGTFYCTWLAYLCGIAQHFGMQPEVDDFRYSTRTFTIGWPVSFLYWNMQYHVEHHMYSAVPFYNLPRLRQALGEELPVAPHGVVATFKELWEIHRRSRTDPDYQFVPRLPGETSA